MQDQAWHFRTSEVQASLTTEKIGKKPNQTKPEPKRDENEKKVLKGSKIFNDTIFS